MEAVAFIRFETKKENSVHPLPSKNAEKLYNLQTPANIE